jgi:hypothetical protein
MNVPGSACRTGVLACALLAACTGAVMAQPQAAVVPEAITVGDVFHAAVRLDLPDELQLVVPDTLILQPDLEAAGRREVRIDTVGATRRATIVYPLSAWRPGTYEIGPLTLQLVGAGTPAAHVVRFPAFAVRSVLPEDTAGIEARAAKDVLGANRVWWPILLALLLALAAAAGLYAWWRRRRPQPVPVAGAPRVAPRVAALRELEELRAAGLLERGEVKLFYARLTETLRHYAAAINERWSADLTTSELSARLRADLPAVHALELLRILGAADLVKFARATPPADAGIGDLDAGRVWVESVGAPEPDSGEEPERRAA